MKWYIIYNINWIIYIILNILYNEFLFLLKLCRVIYMQHIPIHISSFLDILNYINLLYIFIHIKLILYKLRDRQKLFQNNFRFLPSSYSHSTGPDESTSTKRFKKSWSKSVAKFMVSEKCNFDPVRVWTRNFCQTGIIVYDLCYLLLGWFCCCKYDNRENS